MNQLDSMKQAAKRHRRFNEERRAMAASKQEPLPMERQRERAAANAEAHQHRYPVPPLYRLSYRHPEPTQPLCYQFQRGASR